MGARLGVLLQHRLLLELLLQDRLLLHLLLPCLLLHVLLDRRLLLLHLVHLRRHIGLLAGAAVCCADPRAGGPRGVSSARWRAVSDGKRSGWRVAGSGLASCPLSVSGDCGLLRWEPTLSSSRIWPGRQRRLRGKLRTALRRVPRRTGGLCRGLRCDWLRLCGHWHGRGHSRGRRGGWSGSGGRHRCGRRRGGRCRRRRGRRGGGLLLRGRRLSLRRCQRGRGLPGARRRSRGEVCGWRPRAARRGGREVRRRCSRGRREVRRRRRLGHRRRRRRRRTCLLLRLLRLLLRLLRLLLCLLRRARPRTRGRACGHAACCERHIVRKAAGRTPLAPALREVEAYPRALGGIGLCLRAEVVAEPARRAALALAVDEIEADAVALGRLLEQREIVREPALRPARALAAREVETDAALVCRRRR